MAQILDDFNRSDADPVGSPWFPQGTIPGMQIVGNRLRAATLGGGGNHVLYTGHEPQTQTSTVKVLTLASTKQARAICRGKFNADTCYFFFVTGPFGATVGCTLAKYVAGVYTEIGTGSTASLSSGGTISCDVNGTTIRGLVNGVQIYSVTDTSIADGNMGCGTFVSGGAVGDVEIDDFQGDFTSFIAPTITDTIVTNGTGASSTPSVNLPATVNAGDTLLVVFRSAGLGAVGWPDASWNELFDDASDASDDQTACAWKKATGTEGGTSITLSSANAKFAAVAYAIANAADPTTRPPEFATLVTGTSQNPDPGTVTPTGGSKDYMFIAVAAYEGEQATPPTYPTNYDTAPISAHSGTAAATASNCRVSAICRRALASSEDAGSFTISVSDDWTATTIAIHPQAAAIPQICTFQTFPIYRRPEIVMVN